MPMIPCPSLAAAAAILAVAGLARADEPPPGPAPGLTITTPTGTVEVPSGPAQPFAPGAPTMTMQFGGPPPAQGVTRSVSVSSDSEGTRVVLVNPTAFLMNYGMVHQQVCTAPCTAKLTTTNVYMIRGYGISDSPNFGIGDQTRELRVHTGSAALGALGATADTVGVLSAITGIVFLTYGYLDGPTDSSRPTYEAIGWGTLIGGAALLGVGIVMGLTSTTHVYDEGGARLAKSNRPRLTLSGVTF